MVYRVVWTGRTTTSILVMGVGQVGIFIDLLYGSLDLDLQPLCRIVIMNLRPGARSELGRFYLLRFINLSDMKQQDRLTCLYLF